MAREAKDAVEDLRWYAITGNYLVMLIASGLFYLVLHYFWGNDMVVTIHQVLGHGLVWAGLGSVWFIFVWAFAVTAFAILVLGQRHGSYLSRLEQTVKGLWVSMNAGVFEEIIFRLFALLNAMVILTFLNFITFGLVKWWYSVVMVPIANFFTFHALQPQLMEHGWLLGAAIVSASIAFRDGHKYLGFIGWVNSWFIGMVMFWLVFNYGLLTAIAAHIIYDAVIFVFRGLTSQRERGLSYLLSRL